MMAAAFAAVTQGVDEPITLKQALSGPFKEQWAQAVESEFNSLEKQGTWALKSDPGAYVYWQGGQFICILVVYVDDMIFAFEDAVWAADFKTALGARFDIKDSGVCAWALGMTGERDWDNATLKVHQAKYIDDMLHKFNLADAYVVSTPAEVGADVPGSNKPLAAEVPYHALVGSLLYTMVATRPDIAEAVSKLSRAMAKPKERHWQAGERVLRYAPPAPQPPAGHADLLVAMLTGALRAVAGGGHMHYHLRARAGRPSCVYCGQRTEWEYCCDGTPALCGPKYPCMAVELWA
eukprot:jgi/Tetstr1/441425/TSEL_029671.t1